MTNAIEPISESNLSIAWAKAFLNLMEHGAGEIAPLVVTVNDISNTAIPETPAIREGLDDELDSKKEFHIETVASTIFPKSMWNRRAGRDLLYNRYMTIWPSIRRCKQNNRGTYFQRLIDFKKDDTPVNQLELIIRAWRSGLHRNSALQASIFDPRKDHVRSKMLGFPCLQQIALNPAGTNGRNGLVITGFYATQYIFEKAYGNYLGLCRLGQFMAHEMGLELVGMTCIAAKGKLGYYGKGSLSSLKRKIIKLIDHQVTT
jgi:hypothetical protein